MPRTGRVAPGGMVYHVINRGVGRQQLFFTDDDYLAFERVIVETLSKRPMRILGYCLMPNHWHFDEETGTGPVIDNRTEETGTGKAPG